jgi:hypothetical protein
MIDAWIYGVVLTIRNTDKLLLEAELRKYANYIKWVLCRSTIG